MPNQDCVAETIVANKIIPDPGKKTTENPSEFMHALCQQSANVMVEAREI